MSLDTILQQNEIGLPLTATFYSTDGINPQNISGALSLWMYLGRPDFSVISGVANLYTNGTDGKILYNTNAGDLGLVGVYTMQGNCTGASGQYFWSEKQMFLVEPNL